MKKSDFPYFIVGDLVGTFHTGQKRTFNKMELAEIEANADHAFNLHEGTITNVRLVSRKEFLAENKNDLYLKDVDNIQIEKGGEWPFERTCIFDLERAIISDYVLSTPSYMNKKMYAKVSGRIYAEVGGYHYSESEKKEDKREEKLIEKPKKDDPIPLPDQVNNEPLPENCEECSKKVKSGGFGVDDKWVRLGTESGKTYVKFEPYSYVDKLEVFYKDELVWSTHQIEPNEDGFVGGHIDAKHGINKNSTTKWGTFDYKYDGVQDVRVKVTGKEPETKWDYTLYCPNEVPPDARVGNNRIRDFIDNGGLERVRNSGCFRWLWWILLLLLLLWFLKQCTGVGHQVGCYWDKWRAENKITEIQSDNAQIQQEVDQNEVVIQPCNIVTPAGDNQPFTGVYALGKHSGQVRIDYNMKDIPDRMDVYYDGELVATTEKKVSHKGSLTYDYVYDKNRPQELVIKVIPHKSPRTEWLFKLNCP